MVANVGDSRAVICKNGQAKQLSIDHEPTREKKSIESRGGFVSNIPGNNFWLLQNKKKERPMMPTAMPIRFSL